MAVGYDTLLAAVASGGMGVRARTSLTPLRGSGDKISPPTYAVEERATTRYATELRRIDGQDVPTVLLDSVASQANRCELALLEAFRRGRLTLPLTSIDFRGSPGAEHLGLLSDLELSHRIFDAALRESLLDGLMFRESPIGRAVTEASARNAAALLHHAPVSLLLGAWDSTGPRGGKGAKYERALTSEIVGIGITTGTKTASRIDPTGIEKSATLYASANGWTLNPQDAIKDKGKPRLYGKKSPGEPSAANLGNIPPSIDTTTGGVTVDRILATTVLSFVQLRRLRFPFDVDGSPIPGDRRTGAESAAHTALACLGLAAVVLAFDEGFDLRSRCVLVPDGPLTFELLTGAGAEPYVFSLTADEALSLLAEATQRAADLGLGWRTASSCCSRPTGWST